MWPCLYLLPDHQLSQLHRGSPQKSGQDARTEICRWHEGLEGVPSVFDANSLLEPAKEYQPTAQEPFGSITCGFDERPDSLVLTEDDYMRFLVAISRLKGQPTDPIPKRVRQAVSDSALILLGYDLASWAFRVIFWGLIKSASMTNTGVFTLQLKPSPVEQKFFQDYLKLEAKLEVYWGDIYQYTQHLRDSLR
ncbi:MAG: SIR2 family protein [Anaerolineae bacterium]